MNQKIKTLIEELVENCQLNLLVSSPAGSGKTQKLTDRYVSILQSQYADHKSIEPERIVAITFTKKAAAEMKERVLSALLNYPEIHKQFSSKINKVRISTIHSFFLSLYSQFALEADENPQVEVMDENQASELIDRLYHQFVFEKYKDSSAAATEELSFFLAVFGWRSVRMLLQDAVALRSKFFRMLKLQRFKAQIKFDDILAEYIHFLDEGQKDPYRILKIHHADMLKKGTIFIVNQLVQLYEKVKDEQGKIDFDDIELRLLRLMDDNMVNSNLLYDFDMQFDYLLIDEFQDTNFLQWYVIEKLTEEWFSGMGAKQSAGKIPSVFFVGDPKQSIYMFRGANVEVMNIASETFKEKKKIPQFMNTFELVTEKRNFRSRSGIIDFVNMIFSKIMVSESAEKNPWKVNYDYFECANQDEQKGSVNILLYQPTEKMNVSQRATGEAQIIAQKIIELKNSGARFSDIAILLRTRTHLDAFEDSLLNSNIPFKVYKGKGFFKEKEIQIVLALIKFLYNPDDEIALYGLLKSPLYGFNDDQLIELSNIKSSSKFESLKRYAFPIYKELEEFVELYKSEHTYLVINKYLLNNDRYKYFSEKQRYANLIKLFNLLEEMEYKSEDKLEIKKALEYMEEKGNLEKATIIDESYDSVTLLTVHSAKGLEFPYVFAVQLSAGDSGRKDQLIAFERIEPGSSLTLDTDYCVFPVANESETYKEYNERKFEESKRLFYVACTRAKEKLFLSGSFYARMDANSWLKMLATHEFINETEYGFELNEQLRAIASLEIITELPSAINLPSRPPRLKIYLDSPVYSQHSFVNRVPSQLSAWQPSPTDNISSRITGDIMHSLLDKYTRGKIKETDFEREALEKLSYMSGDESLQEDLLSCVNALRRHQVMELARPAQNKFSEFPFIYRKGNELWRGKIDLLIVHDDHIAIYDYKTSRLSSQEITDYASSQLSLYAEAMSVIWPNKRIETFMIGVRS